MGRQSRPKSKTMGAKLKMIRRHSGLSQVGMLAIVRPGHDPENRAVISQYEKGITDPDFPTLLKYALYARLSTDVLIDDSLVLTSEMLTQPPARTKPPKFARAGKPRLPGKDIKDIEEIQSAFTYDTSIDASTDTSPVPFPAANDNAAENFGSGSEKSKTAESDNAAPESAATENAAVRRGEVKEHAAAPPPPAQIATPTAAEESRSGANGDDSDRPKQFKRRLSDRMLDALDHDLEHFSTWLPRRLLDELDDLYLAHLRAVPRRSRQLLDRRYFYHSLFTAFLIRAGERPLDYLSPVWEKVVRQVEDNADQPPDLFSTGHLN